MTEWRAPSVAEVEQMLDADLAQCHPIHRACFDQIRVPSRQVPISSLPGEYATVVAEIGGRVLYWSSVEEGWELDTLDDTGRLAERGCNQFELTHVLHQLFGDPALRS